jgi:hypothetical protein
MAACSLGSTAGTAAVSGTTVSGGVGEALLEHGEAGGQGRELLAAELERRQVVGARRQPVDLAVGGCVGLGGDLDAEARELGAILVEAPLEGLLGHRRVALDPAADLGDAHRLPAAREEQRDEREPPDELVGVLAEAFFARRARAAGHLHPPSAMKRLRSVLLSVHVTCASRALHPPGR